MQQLLTGQTRLPTFDIGWEIQPLDDIGIWVGGATPSMRNNEYWENGSIPWASSGDVKSTLLAETAKSITDKAVKESSTTLAPKNTILIVTRNGILRRHLPVARTCMAVAINQDIKALIPSSGIDSDFLLQTLKNAGPSILANCMKAGTTVESIEYGWLKKFQVAIPALAEQTAIATILSDMDAEITALEARRDKTRDIKQGMIQELLTGRIRLV